MRVPHFIVPPYLLENLERSAAADRRSTYRRSLETDDAIRSRRRRAEPRQPGGEREAGPDRIVYDAQNGTDLPGRQVRAEGEPATGDTSADRAYDGTGATWTMYSECFGRDSVDGAGMRIESIVHYGRDYANAFWDGSRMVFGDGDGEIFRGFTSSVDITGHELTHGVTQYTANLDYPGQPGAVNEHLSDVFGSLAKQYAAEQTAGQADWIIGAGIFTEGVKGVGLRSMKEPGTAYDDPRLGKDPQPADMPGYVETIDDNGGVHINCGIPNRAFYLAAVAIGGHAYDDAGKIWYHTLTESALTPATDFAAFARATQESAKTLYGEDSPQLAAVKSAWHQVGVVPADKPGPQDPDLAQAAATTLTPGPAAARLAAAGPPDPQRPREPGDQPQDPTGGEPHVAG